MTDTPPPAPRLRLSGMLGMLAEHSVRYAIVGGSAPASKAPPM